MRFSSCSRIFHVRYRLVFHKFQRFILTEQCAYADAQEAQAFFGTARASGTGPQCVVCLLASAVK